MKVLYNNTVRPVSDNFVSENNYSKSKTANVQNSFNDILQNKIIEQRQIQFSKHANARLNSRDIKLSQDQVERIESGIKMADEKGINDSLVLVDNIALVVNVKSKLVITAMNKVDNKNVFTNIDGAVIV